MLLVISQQSNTSSEEKDILQLLILTRKRYSPESGQLFSSLAKEENYSIHFILPISFILLTSLNILGTGWPVGYPIV